MTPSRRVHRLLGIVLLLPILGWASTGFVFFIKPGYDTAYAGLEVRRHPMQGAGVPLSFPPERLEVRWLSTVLGEHLLVRSESGWEQLDPRTLEPRELPDDAAIGRLVDDAIASSRDRYGEIGTIERPDGGSPSARIRTTRGVEIDLDWNGLRLRQSGRDTRMIDGLYRVHYLQWTGIPLLDRVLGIVGLVSLIALAALGLRLAIGRGR